MHGHLWITFLLRVNVNEGLGGAQSIRKDQSSLSRCAEVLLFVEKSKKSKGARCQDVRAAKRRVMKSEDGWNGGWRLIRLLLSGRSSSSDVVWQQGCSGGGQVTSVREKKGGRRGRKEEKREKKRERERPKEFSFRSPPQERLYKRSSGGGGH